MAGWLGGCCPVGWLVALPFYPRLSRPFPFISVIGTFLVATGWFHALDSIGKKPWLVDEERAGRRESWGAGRRGQTYLVTRSLYKEPRPNNQHLLCWRFE